jgi:hypothetical protein
MAHRVAVAAFVANILRVGARITARYEDQGGSHVVTTIRREPSWTRTKT